MRRGTGHEKQQSIHRVVLYIDRFFVIAIHTVNLVFVGANHRFAPHRTALIVICTVPWKRRLIRKRSLGPFKAVITRASLTILLYVPHHMFVLPLPHTCKRRKREEAPFMSDCMSGARETSFSKSRINRICRQSAKTRARNRKHAEVHGAYGYMENHSGCR